jgi:excisionase family DNA binding protein
MDKLFNVSEVAELLSVSTSFVYKKAERGELESIKIGSTLRFQDSAVQRYIEKCKSSDGLSIQLNKSQNYNSYYNPDFM